MKILFTITFLFVLTLTTNAQYKINKDLYDSKQYVPELNDPYNPTLAGLSSVLIPGLGQMISGEPGRGFAFLGGFTGSFGLLIAGAFIECDADTDFGSNAGVIIAWTGLAGMGILYVKSISDAVKVSKVNNMAWQNSHGNQLSLTIEPYIGTNKYNNSNPIGLSVRINF